MHLERSKLSPVILSGQEYDVFSTVLLEDELDMLSPAHCAIDFRNVRYIDSTCIGVLVKALKRLRKADTSSTLTLVNVARPVARILDLTHLTTIFTVIPDRRRVPR